MSDVKPVVTPYMTRIHELITEYRDATTAAKKQRARKAIIECVGARDAALQAEIEALRKDAEQWAPVDGFDGAYEVSSLGRVRSLNRVDSCGKRRAAQMMVPTRQTKGYLAVTLSEGGCGKHFFVHRLVGAAFIDNPDGRPQINHKDGDPANNAVSNLEWVTNAENQTHARRILAKGVRAVYAVRIDNGQREDFPTLQHAVEAGFVRANIQKCIAGTRKKHRARTWHDAAIAKEKQP